MGNLDKARKALKQNKKFVIIIVVLWIILAIVLVAPVAVGIERAINKEANLFNALAEEITSFSSFFRMFGIYNSFTTFLKLLIPYTVVVVYFSYKGYAATSVKGEYHDKEHGSSGWSKKGEQYSILSKEKGIILAKDNYLPLDKRGNINTLIVRRFRFW